MKKQDHIAITEIQRDAQCIFSTIGERKKVCVTSWCFRHPNCWQIATFLEARHWLSVIGPLVRREGNS